MTEDEMDRILSRQDEILPSSGFVASVMEAVRTEAEAPQPIPFPWKRALPVLVLAAATLVAVLVFGVAVVGQLGNAGGVAPSGAAPAQSVFALGQGGIASAVRWSILALIGSFVSVRLAMRLATGGA